MTSIFNSISNSLDSYGRSVNIPHTGMTKETATAIMANNPGKVPVVVMKQDNKIKLKKSKFLVPCDLTMGQLVYVLRKHTDNIKA